jgi:hypothetical protein
VIMPRRRWVVGSLLVVGIVLLLGAAVAVLTLPRFLRTVAVWRLEAMTHRSVTLEAIDFDLRTGRFGVRNLRVKDHDGGLLLRVDSLQGRVHRRSLWRAQIWIEDAVLTSGELRIVRTGPDRFNISDLLTSKEPSRGFALTLDHLLIQGVSVIVEDRVLQPPKTWRAEDIRFEATALGTTAPRGVAFGSTTVAGALVTLRAMNIQLSPLHLRAEVNIRDLDLTLADLYMPPDAPTMVESGVAHAALSIDMDAGDGLMLNAEGVVERLAVGRPEVAGDEVTSPELRFLVRELHQRGGTLALRYASLEGDVTVLDPATSPPTPLKLKGVTATVSGLDQAKRAAQVALYGTLPGVGEVDVSGTAGVNPLRTDVRVRTRSIDLGFLWQHMRMEARVDGIGTADVRIAATHDTTLALTVTGDATLDKVTVHDGDQTPVTIKRLVARGLAYSYPATVRVADLTLTEPSAVVERNADGTLNLAALARPRAAPPGAPAPKASTKPVTPAAVEVAVGTLRVTGGRARVTDAVVNGRVEASAIALTAEDVTWPSRGPARVGLATNVAGASLTARGTVDLGPRRTNLAVTARKVDLAVLQPWLPPAAGRLGGTAEADVTLALGLSPLSVEARGTVGGANLAWTDGVRPMLKLASLDVKAEDDVTWPSRGPARVRVVTDVAGGRVSARGTVDLGPKRANLEVAARKVDLAALQPWLPPAAGRVRGSAEADVTLALGLSPLSVEARGTVTGANVAWTDGVRAAINVATLDLRADDNVTWPSRGPARVRLAADVPGGRLTARGTLDAGTRKAELAIKASHVDLAALQPFLPIVGQVRGAADADVTVAVGLEPFTLALKGSLGAGDLAFLEGTKPLITVKRVDASGIDAVWPTKLAMDRLRVNTPWAEVARNKQGELSMRAIFRRRPDLPAAQAPGPDTAAAVTPEAPPPTAGPVPGMQVTLREAIFENGGARIIDDAVEPAARFELAGSHLELRHVTWPSRGAAAVSMTTPMPGSGTLKARGTFSIEPTRLVLDAELDQVDLAPGRPYLPFDARVAGKLTGKAKVTGTFGDAIALVVDGDATVDRLRLGDPERRLVTADKIDLSGFRYSYPTSIRIREATLTKPWMLIERHSDGTLELVSLVMAKRVVAAGPAPLRAPASLPPPTPAKPAPAPPSRVRVLVNKLVWQDGFIRFVDRTTNPAYAEELSRISLVGENLGTTPQRPGAPPRRGTVELRGTFASGTPLAVHGKVGSYPGPLYLDVVVELTDFPVPRLNQYLDRLSSYVARQGTLTATLTYHVEGDDLSAVNDVTIDGLDLETGGHGGEFRKRTGLPLPTLVSLLKDRKGVIKLNIPVSGKLSSPEFEYGEAVWAALRNLTIKLVALPFSLVGKLFFTEDSRIEALQVDPVTFQTAKAAPDKDGAEQLQHLVDFLKETPDVRLSMRPVTTVADVTALRRQALESKLATLGADEAARRQAAVGLYTELFPRREPPTSDEALYDELTRETPTPPRALRALSDSRLAAVHDTLVRAGVPAERLERLESRTAVESEGTPRVEFEIRQ